MNFPHHVHNSQWEDSRKIHVQREKERVYRYKMNLCQNNPPCVQVRPRWTSRGLPGSPMQESHYHLRHGCPREFDSFNQSKGTLYLSVQLLQPLQSSFWAYERGNIDIYVSEFNGGAFIHKSHKTSTQIGVSMNKLFITVLLIVQRCLWNTRV